MIFLLIFTLIRGPAVLPFHTNIIYSYLLLSERGLFLFGSRKLSKTSLFKDPTLSELEIGVSNPRGVKLEYDSTSPHIECGKFTNDA